MSEQQNTGENTPKVPTKQEILKFLDEQLEIKTAQVQVQEQNALLQELVLRELKAVIEIAELKARNAGTINQQDMVDHIVTEEDLKNNPDMVEQNIKVGDHIRIPVGEKI